MTRPDILQLISIAETEQSKSQQWMRITPRLALEILQMALRSLDEPALSAPSTIVPHS